MIKYTRIGNSVFAYSEYPHDEVACFGKRGWISGFTGTSSAYIIDGDGQYIQMPNKNYKQVTLNNVTRICHNFVT